MSSGGMCSRTCARNTLIASLRPSHRLVVLWRRPTQMDDTVLSSRLLERWTDAFSYMTIHCTASAPELVETRTISCLSSLAKYLKKLVDSPCSLPWLRSSWRVSRLSAQSHEMGVMLSVQSKLSSTSQSLWHNICFLRLLHRRIEQAKRMVGDREKGSKSTSKLRFKSRR